jgi:hypothetical protein
VVTQACAAAGSSGGLAPAAVTVVLFVLITATVMFVAVHIVLPVGSLG